MPLDSVPAASKHSNGAPQPSYNGLQSRPGTSEPIMTPSEIVHENELRTRSRGSTASIQSSTTQQTQDQQIQDGFHQLPRHDGSSQQIFAPNPEDMIVRFGEQLARPVPGPPLNPVAAESHHAVMPRAESFQHQVMSHHAIVHHSLPPEVETSSLSNVSGQQYRLYDSGAETHVTDPFFDDNETSEAGGRKKRGSSSTLANDQELRKLLRQYEGYTLKQIAAEVLKHEGNGGRAEKVKQVFAMIWLKENCRKSTGSVRRDRVYCCYAETCGTERVSVLNPASFGKLVRIIFPNVQTRRLGVRGESKYHYVDLTVIEGKQQKASTSNPQISANPDPSASVIESKPSNQAHTRNANTSQTPLDTAVFPSPTISFTPRFSIGNSTTGCACQSSSPSNTESIITLENVAAQSARMVHQMLQFSSSDGPSNDAESIQLPEIRPYLPANTDSKVAAALAALYRSHCISVIDSFRFCKERNFLRYFSSFHGTLTVPVQKLLTHPNLATWIKECDWLMYQKMIAFVAPLTTQVVPQVVLDTFNSISQRLTTHIADTFKAFPVHVSLARLVPAHIFCYLLKHVLDVNQAANAAAAWLCHPDNRNQMWYDFKTLVDPREMISKANIPTCAQSAVSQMLKYDVYGLLSPVSDPNPSIAHPFFKQPDLETDKATHKFRVPSSPVGEDYNFPDKWMAFILNLPSLFPHRRTQCIIDKVNALWDYILRRLTLGGAQSFSAWWMTKVFFQEMILWQAERGGFMESSPTSLQNASFGQEQAGLYFLKHSNYPAATKEGSSVSNDNHGRPQYSAGTAKNVSQGQELQSFQVDTTTEHPSHLRDKSAGLVDNIPNLHAATNDDSAIDLDEDSILMSVSKYGDMMASDPADAEGDVVVI